MNSSSQPLVTLSDNTKDFWLSGGIDHLDSPTDEEFRAALAQYKPLKISGAVAHWPALTKWSLPYIASQCPEDKVYPINITPGGHADAVHVVDDKSYFIFPAEVPMKMIDFVDMICNPLSGDAVPYLSDQNSNMSSNYAEICDDIDMDGISIGSHIFGTPEAVNLWIGDQRSTSSLHKDHFENLYVVISGEKVFTLFPPTDIAFLGEEKFPALRCALCIDPCADQPFRRPQAASIYYSKENCPVDSIPWISVDPCSSTALHDNSSLKYASPLTVKVCAGETLYIPAMWYHRVTQTQPTIAVNFWYDMQFDFRYVFYQLVRNVAYGVAVEKEDNIEDKDS